MENICIKNCNNISEANISIERESFNIKYGLNGTGKTTISTAICLQSAGKSLEGLKPYDSDDTCIPEVSGCNFSAVKVFNEEYVNSYVFKQESIFEDSFRVFLKSEECDKLVKDINIELSGLRGELLSNTSVDTLNEFLKSLFDVVTYSDEKIIKRGGLGEYLKGNGTGFEKHVELDSYKPYYGGDLSEASKWAEWRIKGIERIKEDLCPFCVNKVDITAIDKQNKAIQEVFKNSAVKAAGQVLHFIEEGVRHKYFEKEKSDRIVEYSGDPSKTKELETEIQKLAAETAYLVRKLSSIHAFAPSNVSKERIINIEEELKSMKIDCNTIEDYYVAENIVEIVNTINSKIDDLLINVGKLKGLFKQHEEKLSELIRSREDDINECFAIIGFPYTFAIRSEGEEKAKANLIPTGLNEKVDNPQKHLSWGERNAFALVMFMFDAYSNNADLVILDDPITSFDINKKYGVMKRLFTNEDVSLRKRTVVMLTHDTQPLIDYVYGSSISGDNIRVYASYLENDNGNIIEEKIDRKDLLNVYSLTDELAKDSSKSVLVRIVNARKHMQITIKEYQDNMGYQLLSNLIHGRVKPTDNDEIEMTGKEIEEGLEDIQYYFKGYSTYEQLRDEMTGAKLLDIIDKGNKYEKILAARVLFIRNEELTGILRKKYPSIHKIINETNHIENDYLLQLNPLKFDSIPKQACDILFDLIDSHRNVCMSL